MGTNKRYAEYYDRQMDARILQRIAAGLPAANPHRPGAAGGLAARDP